MRSSNTEPLDRELRELPRVSASPGFTRRVLRRLEKPAATSPLPRFAWVTLGALAAILTVLALRPDNAPDRQARLTASEAREIRKQHALLAAELDRLRSNTEAAAPILYLGGDDEVDYVLDLSPFLLSPAGGILPASSDSPQDHF